MIRTINLSFILLLLSSVASAQFKTVKTLPKSETELPKLQFNSEQLKDNLSKVKYHKGNIPFSLNKIDLPLPGNSGAVIKDINIYGIPTWIEGNLLNEQDYNRQEPSKALASFIAKYPKFLPIQNPENELKAVGTTIDEEKTHIRYTQTYKGLDVWNSEVIMHFDDGKPYLFNGRLIPTPDFLETTPVLTLNDAFLKAKALHPPIDFTPAMLQLLQGPPIEGQLLIYADTEKRTDAVLAYYVKIRPDLIRSFDLFFDAKTGQLINEFKGYCTFHHDHSDFDKNDHQCAIYNEKVISESKSTPLDGPFTATATDLNNVSRTINTYQVGSTYYFIDGSRPMFNNPSSLPDDPKGAIWTINAGNKSPENTNFSVAHVTSNNNSWNNPTAVSAHYNAGLSYEYFRSTFNRNSIDGVGGTVVSIINVTESDGSSMENAFWNGKAMFYGNGGQAFEPLAGGLDVGAHEMSHGVIQATANLTYQNESGALNESFADIFGVLIDRDDYKLGEDIVKTSHFPSGAMRDMSNPHNGGNSLNDNGYQPNHMNEKYTGTQDNGGVHINSGIVNFAFFKIASQLGKTDAEQIYYAALTKYLIKSSQFIDCRNAVVQATKDKYGNGSSNIALVEKAFSDVGIGAGSGTDEPDDYEDNPGQNVVIYTNPNGSTLSIKLLDQAEPNEYVLDYNGGVASKPSMSDDGTVGVFVGQNGSLYYILFDWSGGQYEIDVLNNQTAWRNAVISKDGSQIALVTSAEEPVIYVLNLQSGNSQAFELYNPTTGTGGIFTGDVQYADAMEFDHTGQYLMYDAFSELNFQGTAYWDIGFMDVWNNASNSFGTGEIQKLYSSLPDNVSVGNPVFSKNSPQIISFDYLEESTSTAYYLVNANIETGDANVIFENGQINYPCFSTDDQYVIFNATSGQEGVLGINALNADKISANGQAQLLINQAYWGTWFGTGERVISSNKFTEKNDLTDVVRIYPNPVLNNLDISWENDQLASGQYRIFNVNGEQLLIGELKLTNGVNQVSVNCENLVSGNYFIELSKGDRTKTIKFIKK